MFERLEARAARAAEMRAGERKAALAAQLRELLPRDILVEPTEEGVLLSGPGLGQRIVLDASLRWTIAGLLK
ncbi:MAG TPA: hypothetical protein VEC11_10175 [Allosphingosinicella sp.]|nr:hypothetical protein [Allosphingosinicella sp.]